MLEYRHEEELQFQAQLYDSGTRDPLTSVHNRRHLERQLAAELSFARRHGTALSVFFVDVDNLKTINDTLGHLAGDAALKLIAEVIAKRVRAEDLVVRYGGDEFVVVLRDTPVEGARALGESLLRLIAAARTTSGFDFRLTASIGVATMLRPANYSDGSDLLAAADGALYAAERAGRNRLMVAGDAG